MTSIPLYKILVVDEAAHFGMSPSDKASLSEIIAIELLMSQIDRMLDVVSRAQSGARFISTDEFKTWRHQVDTVKTELANKSRKREAQLSQTFQVIQKTQMLESTLKNTMSPQMTASLRFGRGLSAQGLR